MKILHWLLCVLGLGLATLPGQAEEFVSGVTYPIVFGIGCSELEQAKLMVRHNSLTAGQETVNRTMGDRSCEKLKGIFAVYNWKASTVVYKEWVVDIHRFTVVGVQLLRDGAVDMYPLPRLFVQYFATRRLVKDGA